MFPNHNIRVASLVVIQSIRVWIVSVPLRVSRACFFSVFLFVNDLSV